MAKRSKSTFKTVISALLVIILLTLSVGFGVLLFKNDGKVDGMFDKYFPHDDDGEAGGGEEDDNPIDSDMTVTVNGEAYESESSVITIKPYDALDVAVDNVSSYSIRVVPRAGKDFVFKASGMKLNYKKISNISSGFEVDETTTGVRITPEGGINKVLSRVYSDSTIVIPAAAIDYTDGLYTVVVTDRDTGAVVNILLEVLETYDGLFTLSQTEIVF